MSILPDPFSCQHSLALSFDFLACSLWGSKLSCWRLTQRGTENCSWPTASKELKLSVQKPRRKWTLPTTMWVNLGMCPSPVNLETTTSLPNTLPPVRDSEAEELDNLTWVSDPQQLWADKCCCFKPLSFGGNWLLYWKELIQQAWAAQTWHILKKVLSLALALSQPLRHELFYQIRVFLHAWGSKPHSTYSII